MYARPPRLATARVISWKCSRPPSSMASRIMRALGVVAVLQCINQRERGFALRQVIAQMLAETRFVGLVVERIVDELECGADVLADSAQATLR